MYVSRNAFADAVSGPLRGPAMRRTIHLPGVLSVWDDVLPEPGAYRQHVLAREFASVTLGDDTFHGIALDDLRVLPDLITHTLLPGTTAPISFWRQSPEGQIEPHFVHSDADMGDWTGIYYLNPDPPIGDGTGFYRHPVSGVRAGRWSAECEGIGISWDRWAHVEARSNRLLLFKADLYHARGWWQNYGTGDDARLIQVVFIKVPLAGR